jgi:predicted metal-dependent phosphoesterase TrpH
LLDIPLIYVRHKQVFSEDMLRLRGKPVDVAKKLKSAGCTLIHIVDEDALAGNSSNLDIYDNLTYFINVEVECASKEEIVHKLLSLKCRVVLAPPLKTALSGFREKKLLVAKVPHDYAGGAAGLEGFHDVIIKDADDAAVARFAAMGKRVIAYQKDLPKLGPKAKEALWGAISTF